MQLIRNCMVNSICENMKICLVRISLKATVTIKGGGGGIQAYHFGKHDFELGVGG